MSDPSSDYADTEQHEGELDDVVTWGRSSDQQQKLEMFSTVTGAGVLFYLDSTHACCGPA